MNYHTTFKIACIIFAAALSGNLQAQKGYLWEIIGRGVNSGNGFDTGSVIQKCKYMDEALYVSEFNMRKATVTIHRWNGTSWVRYPDIQSKKGNKLSVLDLEVYKGELYICGEIDSIKGLGRPGHSDVLNIIKFNGEKWDTLPPSFRADSFSMITGLKVYKNKLFYIGNSDDVSSASLMSLDNAGNIRLVNRSSTAKFNCLEVVNKQLIIGGSIDMINGNKTSGMFYYDGTGFSYTKNKGIRNIYSISVKNDMEYLVVDRFNNKLELWKGDSLQTSIGQPPYVSKWYYYTFTFFKENIIAKGYIPDNFHMHFNYNLDSLKWYMPYEVSNGINIAVPAGQDKAIIVLYGRYTYKASPIELKLGAIITGKVYLDPDSSCTFTAADKLLKNTGIPITLRDSTHYFSTISDKDGNYSAIVAEGTYDVQVFMNEFKATLAPCAAISVSAVAGSLKSDVDIPVHISMYRNLGVRLHAVRGFVARHGFGDKYLLTGVNYSLKKDSLIMKLKYPSNISVTSSSIKPFSNTDNELVFKFHDLEFKDSRQVEIYFSTSVKTSSIGDHLNFYGSIMNSDGDSLMDNNEDLLEVKIVAAVDPNIKQCSPEGKVKPGLKKIKYAIQFQNTGNDTAFKVTVVDTITQKLGLRSLRVTGTSHPATYALRVADGQTLIWEFDNILLPDSHTNEKASHGFIAFEADINGKLAEGDSITNKAYIYFDYQKPVITNTASIVAFTPQTGLDPAYLDVHSPLKLYPNPAAASVHVAIDKSYNEAAVCLFNNMGQLICREQTRNNRTDLHLSGLPAGIYYIRIEGTQTAAMLLVE